MERDVRLYVRRQQGRVTYVKKGDRLITIEPTPASGVTQWRGPFSSGFHCVIPPETVLVVVTDPNRPTNGFACEPEAYDEMEQTLVPEEDRRADGYNGYSVVLSKDVLGKTVRRLV